MLKQFGRFLNIAFWIAFVIALLLLVAVPIATGFMLRLDHAPSPSVRKWVNWLNLIQVPTRKLFSVGWIFFVGSCFASFLNVVAYRVPRGISVFGSSQCPSCKVQLKFPITNMPVLGWLKNGGRCHNCDIKIPVRYLLAELALGFTFLVLFLVETASGGATIPFRTPDELLEFDHVLFLPPPDLIVTLVYQLTILSLIFTFAIAATEKFTAPISLIAIGLVSIVGIQLAGPAPGVLKFRFGVWENQFAENSFLKFRESPIDFLFACGLGAAASVFCFLAIRLSNHRWIYGGFASLFLVGIGFGWQATVSVTVIACLLLPLLRLNISGILFVATLIHLCLWRSQTWCQWWPGPASGIFQLICGAIYIGLLTAFYRYLSMQPPDAPGNQLGNLPTRLNDLE